MFPTYRKFFVLFGILILFVIFFANYWKMYAIESFIQQPDYPEHYYYGQTVNIDGKHLFGNPKGRYDVSGGPLVADSAADCDMKCRQQPECNRRNGNICNAVAKDNRMCFCTFSQNKESFQPRIYENINQVFSRVLTNLPNTTKPSWVHKKTEHIIAKVDKEYIKIEDLKVDNFNNFSLSFWLIPDINNTPAPIISIGHKRKGKGYHLISKTSNSLVINIPGNPISIGTDGENRWVTFTIENGLYKVYDNGSATGIKMPRNIGTIPSLSGKNLYVILNNTRASGLFIKDLRVYNHAFTEDDVGKMFASF